MKNYSSAVALPKLAFALSCGLPLSTKLAGGRLFPYRQRRNAKSNPGVLTPEIPVFRGKSIKP